MPDSRTNRAKSYVFRITSPGHLREQTRASLVQPSKSSSPMASASPAAVSMRCGLSAIELDVRSAAAMGNAPSARRRGSDPRDAVVKSFRPGRFLRSPQGLIHYHKVALIPRLELFVSYNRTN
jgi:hypothetical protein